MKAFLSHSSLDKELVRKVALELGRQYCVFDEQSFETGTEFKQSIEKGLDEADVFVLFASKNALASLWVGFEIEEAWYRQLQKHIKKSLVYIIDSDCEIDSLPEWLRRAKIRHEIGSKSIAREIRYFLEELYREKQQPYFVGRTTDLQTVQGLLAPYDGNIPPRYLAVSGLPAIGRRSFAKRVASFILNLPRKLEISVEVGDSIQSICIKLADHLEPYNSSDGLRRVVERISKLDESSLKLRFVDYVKALTASGELLCLVDEGGMIDEYGSFTQPIKSLLETLDPEEDAYVFLISKRRPQRGVPSIHLNPLSNTDTRTLISSVANREGLRLSGSQISEIAEYVGGFPPAAYYAVRLAKDYGVELLLSDKAQLVEFNSAAFLRFMRNLSLTVNQQHICTILATYSPIPLPVIGAITGLNPKELSQEMIGLIDLSLVVSDDSGYYRAAEPIYGAISKVLGYPSQEDRSKISDALGEFLKSNQDDDSEPKLELMRLHFRTSAFAGARSKEGAFVYLPTDVYRVAEDYYRRRQYEKAVEFSREAVSLMSDNTNAHNLLIRSLIQCEDWDSAIRQIESLRSLGDLRNVYFLRGFLERKRERPEVAIEHYKEAERLGRRGGDISRELGYCLYLTGDLDEAATHLKAALEKTKDDPFLLDLWIQIASGRNDEDTARLGLQRLEAIEKSAFYYHRRSTVELRFGNLDEALENAQTAVSSEEDPSFGMLMQLALCQIKHSDLEQAGETLLRLDERYSKSKIDVRTQLRATWQISRKKYKDALALLEKLSKKDSYRAKYLRLEALKGELKFSYLPDDVRERYENEVDRLSRELGSTEQLDIFLAFDVARDVDA